jgi:hypothetical protein
VSGVPGELQKAHSEEDKKAYSGEHALFMFCCVCLWGGSAGGGSAVPADRAAVEKVCVAAEIAAMDQCLVAQLLAC